MLKRIDYCNCLDLKKQKDLDKILPNIKSSIAGKRFGAVYFVHEILKKDLSQVESAFKHMKAETLELLPWFVLKEESTRGHTFVAMLAYLVVKYLQKARINIDITVIEGLNSFGFVNNDRGNINYRRML